MILFKQIRWRNFLSTGNHFTEIDFVKAQTNLIVGTNGAGKSTVLDALTFSLFNKPFRKITKSQLVNAANEKDCEVQIEFTTPGFDWKIVRGIKPNRFEIWRDDELLDQNAAANDQQKWLEENVLKLNYKSFTQIVVLGSASFVPFMQLNAPNRREVIEDILDIKIFSSMGLILKERVRSTNERIRELTIKKDLTEEKIDMQKSFISDLEETGRKDIDKKKQKLENIFVGIGTHRQIIEDTDKKLKSINDDMESFGNSNKKLRKLGNLKGKLSNKVSNITKEHKFFSENVTCPTCTQNIEESFRLNKINEAESKAKELKKGYEELESAIKLEEDREQTFKKLTSEATKLTHEISKTNTRISGLENQSRELEQEIQTITEQLKNRTAEKHALETLLSQLDDLQKDQSEFREKNAYHEFAHSLMKDGGVKSKIIKRYLPLMNQQINKYLQLMDFYINFSLDEEFKESIKSPVHEDFSYESFSEGEKMRIDLSLLFTWRDIAKMKNSVSTNLLILDEIFDSSLDGFGTDYFTRIIKYVVTDANVFVISHKTDELVDKFDNILKFDKIKGFSKLTT
jgi:DNA repair exonuclease SbcCD ATPase subunit